MRSCTLRWKQRWGWEIFPRWILPKCADRNQEALLQIAPFQAPAKLYNNEILKCMVPRWNNQSVHFWHICRQCLSLRCYCRGMAGRNGRGFEWFGSPNRIDWCSVFLLEKFKSPFEKKHDGSMGMIYLPTWMVDFWWSIRRQNIPFVPWIRKVIGCRSVKFQVTKGSPGPSANSLSVSRWKTTSKLFQTCVVFRGEWWPC